MTAPIVEMPQEFALAVDDYLNALKEYNRASDARDTARYKLTHAEMALAAARATYVSVGADGKHLLHPEPLPPTGPDPNPPANSTRRLR